MTKHIQLGFIGTVLSTLFVFSPFALADKPSGVLVESRYTSIALGAEASQLNLLKTIVELRIPAEIVAVGDSLEYLLTPHGYEIGNSQESHEQYLLFSLPLPESHRQLGPMTLENAIHVLGGESFEPVINPVTRSITYALREEFSQFVSAEDLENAKTSWEAMNLNETEAESCETKIGLDRYGPVQAGETLSSIVIQVGFSGLSRSQSLVLLFQTNPHAFEGENMNHLMQGVMLEVPEWSDVNVVSQFEANQIVFEHYRRWTQSTNLQGE